MLLCSVRGCAFGNVQRGANVSTSYEIFVLYVHVVGVVMYTRRGCVYVRTCGNGGGGKALTGNG